MKTSHNKKYYSILISREILGSITLDESKELKEWIVRSQKNQDLYNNLRSEKNIDKWLSIRQQIDTQSDYIKLTTKLDYNKKRKLRVFSGIKYAAIIIIILCVNYIVKNKNSNNLPNSITLSQDIQKPGHNRAKLILSSGESVSLEKQDTIIPHNNGNITIDSTLGEINFRSPIQENDSTDEIDYTKKLNTIIVPKKGEYKIRLNDGTLIFINSESKLQFPEKFCKNKREVYLEGEAYFKVAHNASKPFVVKTQNMDVMVLGTEFNLKAYKDENTCSTTLIKGKVNIKYNDSDGHGINKILKPNQQARLLTNSKLISITKVDTEPIIAWHKGQFLFKNERLEDIMKSLARWYGFNVIYTDECIKNIRCDGRIKRSETLEPVIDIIKSINNLKIKIDGYNLIISN